MGKTRGEKIQGFRRTFKAIVIVACTALSLRQVLLLVEEYISTPTISLYTIDDAKKIPAPAFTICPKPSLKGSFNEEKHLEFKVFKNFSLSLLDFVIRTPYQRSRLTNRLTVKGETIIQFLDGDGYWTEQTFSVGSSMDGTLHGCYFTCFTLFLEENMRTGPSHDYLWGVFIFDFKQFRKADYAQIEVFVHDKRENFTALDVMEPEKLFLFNDTVAYIFIRPEVIHKQNRKENPCTTDENHSYSRCMENCFWERAQSHPGLSCLNPALLTKDVNLTLPECQDHQSEERHLRELSLINEKEVPNLTSNCNCPKRCKVTDYHVSANPAPACQRMAESYRDENRAILFFSFPSKRVPQFHEKEKVTLLDLLSNIGGIVGICLGVSLISLFDIIDHIFLAIIHKIN